MCLPSPLQCSEEEVLVSEGDMNFHPEGAEQHRSYGKWWDLRMFQQPDFQSSEKDFVFNEWNEKIPEQRIG